VTSPILKVFSRNAARASACARVHTQRSDFAQPNIPGSPGPPGPAAETLHFHPDHFFFSPGPPGPKKRKSPHFRDFSRASHSLRVLCARAEVHTPPGSAGPRSSDISPQSPTTSAGQSRTNTGAKSSSGSPAWSGRKSARHVTMSGAGRDVPVAVQCATRDPPKCQAHRCRAGTAPATRKLAGRARNEGPE